MREKIQAARPRYQNIFIAYADCGTAGLLDTMLADEGVERLPGAHCYELYAGAQAFAAIAARSSGRLPDRFPGSQLRSPRDQGARPRFAPGAAVRYFGNYTRLVYLSQTEDSRLMTAARRAARRLGLAFEHRRTGYGDLETSVIAAAGAA